MWVSFFCLVCQRVRLLGCRRETATLISGLTVALVASELSGQPVEFELATEQGAPLSVSQEWLAVFRDLPETTLRIRSARPGDRPLVENRGSPQSPRYHVVGLIDTRGRLDLPHSRPVNSRQIGAIREWIRRLRDEGSRRMGAELGAFDLTQDEWQRVTDRLQNVVVFDTKGLRAGSVVRRLVRQIGLDYQVSDSARRAFQGQEKVHDELRGLSCGTALAATLRPLGLVVAPEQQRGDIVLRIAVARELGEVWPIGWPTAQSPYRAAPELFEYLNFEIDNVSLRRTLAAVGERVETPILLDYNRLAELRVDLDQQKVSFPPKRTFFKKVLDVILFQAHLSSEIRRDEAGTPFLWVTSTTD